LILLNKLLEDGNTLYRKNRFEDAAHRYQYAIKRIPHGSSVTQQQQLQLNSQPQDQGTFEQLKVHLYLNLSRCRRKMGQFGEAARLASEVLEFRPKSLEAMHARARAYRSVFRRLHN
jgi:tetratricopeptide (TPR) repeat protein